MGLSISFLGTRYEIAGQVPQGAENEVYEMLQDLGDKLLLEAVKEFQAAYKLALRRYQETLDAGFKSPTEGQTLDNPLELHSGYEGFFVIADGWKRYLSEFLMNDTERDDVSKLRLRDKTFFAYVKTSTT